MRTRRIVEPTLTRTLYTGVLVDRLPTILMERVQAMVKALIRKEVAPGAWEAKLAEYADAQTCGWRMGVSAQLSSR
jgi:hypothetical protein